MPALDESDFTIVDRQGNDASFGSLASTGLGARSAFLFAKRSCALSPRRTLTDWVWLYEEENAREEAIAEAERAGALVLC